MLGKIWGWVVWLVGLFGRKDPGVDQGAAASAEAARLAEEEAKKKAEAAALAAKQNVGVDPNDMFGAKKEVPK